MRNPFADDIFVEGGAGEGPAPAFQAGVVRAMADALGETDGAMGRALVVTAPRAGYGKSFTVARFATGLAGRAFVVPLRFDLESPPRWGSVLDEVVEKLHRDHGHRAGLTLLDEAARFLFARVNQRLIQGGQIPCTHPTEAVAALDRNYLEMFDFGNREQVVARWFSEHFETLVPLSAAGLAPETGVDPSRVGHWLRILVAYAQGVGELPSRRLEALRWAMHSSAATALGGGGSMIIQESAGPDLMAKEALSDLGRLLCLYRPVVFVVDHLDPFFRDGAAGLRIAYFISELRRLLPRSLSVVCLNDDLWQATFQSQLPSALEDRVAGAFVALQGLTRDQAVALLQGRLTDADADAADQEAFWSRLGLDDFFAAQAGRPVSPRAVLRHAAACWSRRSRPLRAPAAPTVVPIPPPMVDVAGREPAAAAGGDITPASSVVGAETLDSISAALQAMVNDGPPVAQGSAPFQRLREKLDLLRPAPAAPTTQSGSLPAAPPPSPLATVFSDRLNRRAGAPVPPTLDLERLGRLLRFAGEHFPVVRAAELGVPGTSGTALQWLSPDAEILIGLESATRPIFWSALTAHASARLKLNGGLPVKIVAFTESDGPTHPATVGPSTKGEYAVDLVVPTNGDLHQLAAACDVLDEVEAGRISGGEQDMAALLVQTLEPFWRRLTRLSVAPAA